MGSKTLVDELRSIAEAANAKRARESAEALNALWDEELRKRAEEYPALVDSIVDHVVHRMRLMAAAGETTLKVSFHDYHSKPEPMKALHNFFETPRYYRRIRDDWWSETDKVETVYGKRSTWAVRQAVKKLEGMGIVVRGERQVSIFGCDDISVVIELARKEAADAE